MYFRILCSFVLITLSGLTGCAAVDRFGSRITDHNLTSQDVMNKEILINIVRAGRYQPMNFMVITQVNGGQSETMTTGLPTITFGPAQSITQHQFPISNSVASGATGSYQSNPLVSSQFQQGMMSPVSPKVLAYLLANHDRETVLHLVLESVHVTSGKTTLRYVNDPSNDIPAKDGSPPRACTVTSAADALNAHDGSQLKFLLDEDACNYSKFRAFLRSGMWYGVSAELVPAPETAVARGRASSGIAGAPGVGGGASVNATMVPQATGRLCWDPGLARSEVKKAALKLQPQCSKNLDAKNTGQNFDFPFGSLGTLQFELRFRSPEAIFTALGRQLYTGAAPRVTSLLESSQRLFDGEPLLTVKTEDTGDCVVAAEYEGQTYCVPQRAMRTALVINILEELKNLSTAPSDLNSAFSVRVVN